MKWPGSVPGRPGQDPGTSARSHSRPQESRSLQGGATGGAGREDGSTGQQGATGVVQARRVINDPPGAHSAETIAAAVDVVEADLWGDCYR